MSHFLLQAVLVHTDLSIPSLACSSPLYIYLFCLRTSMFFPEDASCLMFLQLSLIWLPSCYSSDTVQESFLDHRVSSSFPHHGHTSMIFTALVFEKQNKTVFIAFPIRALAASLAEILVWFITLFQELRRIKAPVLVQSGSPLHVLFNFQQSYEK